ncbi:MAG: 10 kDa chaperonin 5 [Chlamydiae bacterium]|nr:10 kDa chaperonin 5 [Chlamydiota bacterium]
MNIQPLDNRILVKRAQALSSKGGILLPESAQEKPKEGEVVSVGPGKRDKDGELEVMDLKVGDRVLFGAYAGVEVKTDQEDEEYLILTEEDVLGILVMQ